MTSNREEVKQRRIINCRWCERDTGQSVEDVGSMFQVSCGECSGSGPTENTIGEAIDEWNRIMDPMHDRDALVERIAVAAAGYGYGLSQERPVELVADYAEALADELISRRKGGAR